MCKIGRFLLILWVSIASQLLAGTVYYVATNGNNSYNGLYPSYQGGSNGPFLTLGKAASTVRAGDTVQIRGGTYHETVTWSTNGTAANRITITNYPGETPIIDGEYTLPTGSVYYFLGTVSGDYVTFSNITIKRSAGSLFVLSGDYIQAINVIGEGSRESGMVAGGNYNLFDGCTMTDNGNGYGINGQATWGSSICTVGANTTIQNCIAYENRGEGLNAYSRSSNVIMQDNIAYDNRSYNLYLDSSNGGTVRRNIIYQTKSGYHMNGITVGAETGMPADLSIYNNLVMGCRVNFEIDSNVTSLSNVFVAYNTFVNSVGGVAGYTMGVYYRPDINTYSNSIFKNNIVIEEDAGRVPISVESSHNGLTFSYNCWNKTPAAAAQGTGDVIGDPKLAKTGPTGAGLLTPAWFQILENSPAKDRAQVLSEVTEDFYKTPRGSAPDMGAFEYSDGTSSLIAAATGSPTSGQAPLAVNFTGSASGGTSPYSYRWTFGDGGNSTAQNPSHTYSSAGSYTATLTVTDSAVATASKSLTITATVAPPALAANASASPTSGQAPLIVSFTGSASGGTSPYSYRWTFGDGGSSTSQNPSHTYSSAGSYTATLTVTDSQSATNSKSLTITVISAPTQLVATASASPTSGQVPLTVSFSGSASGGTSPYSYSWTFGDGGSSTSQNPSHTYSSAGSYTATLTVTDSVSATASKSLTITATAAPTQLVATASASPTAGPAPLAVSFTDGASGGTPPYSYNWDFGDGTSSLSQNPGHVYSTLGNYVATLTVTDYLSASADAMIDISVVSDTTAVLGLSAETGAPAPGEGGTTDPTPGNHSFSIGSAVEVDSIPKTDYRFSKWTGDIVQASMFNLATTITLNTNKSLLATFCTKCADVNGDLKITPSDAQLAFDLYLGRIASPTWCELENADVNCSGTKLVPKITPADAQIIFRRYLRKGTYSSTCSGNSRAAAASQQNMLFSNAAFTIDSSFLTSGGDILIPIIIESPSKIGAFGFDLAFPSDNWTYVGLEGTDLTSHFDQLAGNVISYQASGPDQSAAAVPNDQFLRVGGYKTSDDKNASVGVLVTLVFRAKTGFVDPSEIWIIAAYDDIQNASIYAGSSIRWRNDERRAENRRPADQRRGKAISRKFDF